MSFWKKIWEALKPDPYFYIWNVMWIEGYTDLEIEMEINRLKKANGDLNDDDRS